MVIPLKYESASNFSGGLAAVETHQGKWGYIDKTGRRVIAPQFDYASDFSEGLACVQVGEKFGFINKLGMMTISSQFSSPGGFSEGLASVRLGGKTENPYGLNVGPLGGKQVFIDKKGNIVISLPVEVENANPFVESLAAVEIKGYWGFIDRTGKMIIEPKFGGQPSFSEGLAFVILRGGGGIGYIDKKGAVVIKPDFALADNFRGGLAVVYDSLDLPNAKIGYIDKLGNTVWQPSK
jgi:hypothetical protein